jgi:hypothetical protein
LLIAVLSWIALLACTIAVLLWLAEPADRDR